jgi:hypothetical protein
MDNVASSPPRDPSKRHSAAIAEVNRLEAIFMEMVEMVPVRHGITMRRLNRSLTLRQDMLRYVKLRGPAPQPPTNHSPSGRAG